MSGKARGATEVLDGTPEGSQWSGQMPRKREHECKQILQRLQKEIIMDFKIKYIFRKNQLKHKTFNHWKKGRLKLQWW